ncbi:carboxypeptidase regulatory-like domain-containing protein [Silvibacterium acidisoli]|uniref:carboxypeptidase regulatory-like domain-containing protein n=1 Tax=Acidobacteriaceae bacterium ZG23-2 TaxID=2883246 RepID=UPI00406CA6B6
MKRFVPILCARVSCRATLAALVLFLACSFQMLGQGVTADISGTVTDETGAVVPGAQVVATNTATNVATSAVTNGSGVYSIRFLQIGNYTLTVTAPGFSTWKANAFDLEVGQVAKVDAKLSVGAVQTVTASAELAPILNTDNGTLSTAISESLINDLPINGHNFETLAQYAPGVNVSDGNQWNGASGSPNNSGERTQSFATLPNVNGNRTYNNNYLLDGISIIDTGANISNGFGVPAYAPAAAAVKEVNILTAVPPAEYGDATGAQLIQVMRNGTNEYHGQGYFYLQNYNMDANTFGNKRSSPATARAPYTQRIFGATLGGPVRIPHFFDGRNKLFFFVDYEAYRKPTAGDGQTSVPLNAWRGNTGGATSVDPSLSPLTGYAYFGSAVPQLYDSQNGYAPFNQTINGTTYQNLVPIRNPVATYLFAHPELWPLANHAAATAPVQYNYQSPVKTLDRNDQADIKVDWKISDRDSIFARVSGGEAWDSEPTPATPISFPTVNDFPFKQYVGNYIHIFTPNIVNDFRAGFTRIGYESFNEDPSGLFGNGDSLIGIPFSQSVSGFSLQSFTQSTNSTGVTSVGTAATGNIALDNHFSYNDTLTWSRGVHTMKFGAQLFRIQNNYYLNSTGGLLGSFAYSGSFTGNPNAGQSLGYDFADFVLDYVSSRSVETETGDVGQRQYRFAAFAQDDWKVTPALTVNYGLRWQYDQPVYEVNNKISNVDPTTAQVILAGVDGNSRSLYKPTYNQFNPRLGFAWQESPRLVVRGGFAITTFSDYNVQTHTGNAPYHLTVNQVAVTPTTASPGTPYAVGDGFPTATGATSQYTAWNALHPQWVPQWNLTTEYQLSNSASFSIGYVGEVGQHLSDIRNINQYKLAGQPTSAPFYSAVGSSLIKLLETEAYMNYNGLQAQFRQRTHNGLEFTVNYTYSKNLSDSGGPIGVNDTNSSSGYPQNSYCLKCEYGPTGNDTRHMFNWTARYELPFGHGRQYMNKGNPVIDEIFGGWVVSANSVLLSGFPDTITASGSANVGTAGSLRANHYRHMVVKNRAWGYVTSTIAGGWGTDPSAVDSGGTNSPCAKAGFDDGTCAYGQPALAATGATPIFGDASVGSERSPGYQNYDAAAEKAFRVWRDQSIDFKCSAYNVGNISSYNNPGRGVDGSSTWGLVQSTRSQQRQLELQLEYKF